MDVINERPPINDPKYRYNSQLKLRNNFSIEIFNNNKNKNPLQVFDYRARFKWDHLSQHTNWLICKFTVWISFCIEIFIFVIHWGKILDWNTWLLEVYFSILQLCGCTDKNKWIKKNEKNANSSAFIFIVCIKILE